MSSAQTLPQSVWPSKALPAPATSAVLAQIGHFLQNLGSYDKTVKALLKESKSNGITVDINAWPGELKGQHPAGSSLGDLYVDILLQDIASDDESASEANSSDDSSSESDSGSESDSSVTTDVSKEHEKQDGKHQSLKRKRSTSEVSDTSDSSSDSDSDSSEDEAPVAKKAKKAEKAESSVRDASSSDDSSSDSNEDDDSAASASSSSDSDSTSESESESESEEEAPKVKKAAKKVVKTDKALKTDTQRNDSISAASSETLAGSPQPNNQAESMHPSRQVRMQPQPSNVTPTAGAKKKFNEPFSRIPKDTAVDPRFASNAYIPYDYANRAHQDLVVTKGKGFTKEKNKKKRGSYRGGVIDTTPKGIKFDD